MADLGERLNIPDFSASEFLDNTVWRALTDTSTDGSTFDPIVVHGAVCQQIQQLREHQRKLERKVKNLEENCVDEIQQHRKKIKTLLKKNSDANQSFQELDERITSVATKVVHLGDQIDSINVPRNRNHAALQMMRKILDYTNIPEENFVMADITADPIKDPKVAELVQQLDIISNQLPNDPKFNCAKKHIEQAYDTIQDKLVTGFLGAYQKYDECSKQMKKLGETEQLKMDLENELKIMKTCCDLLRNFRHSTDAISQFIETSLKQGISDERDHIFVDIVNKCKEIGELAKQVFINFESVMVRYVSTIFQGRLREFIRRSLGEQPQTTEVYLKDLAYFYGQTKHLAADLRKHLTLGKDTTFIDILITKTIFKGHLESYDETEFKFLNEKSSSTLSRYYDSRNHVKRSLQAGGLSDIRREVQSRMHINIGLNVDQHTGEVFLSQETAISMLQLYKLSFKRAADMIEHSALPQHCSHIYNVMERFICSEFIDYAIELALYHCPLPDSKTQPKLYFLQAVSDASSIMYLFEKQVVDNLMTEHLYSFTDIQECFKSKLVWSEKFEQKLDLGLERLLAAICGYLKNLLSSEQKRSDFKPESDDVHMIHSQACQKVVSYMNEVVDELKRHLDAMNLVIMLTELGLRVHRVIYEHLLTFQYNSMGAMLAICDINEYRTCIKQLGDSNVETLFEVLHRLCNLLVVPVDNLSQICTEDPLGRLDQSIISSFVQLRSDYQKEKVFLGNLFSRF